MRCQPGTTLSSGDRSCPPQPLANRLAPGSRQSRSERRRSDRYSVYWVEQIARRYNVGGADALDDQRHHNQGVAWLLSEEQKQQLEQALQQPPEDGSLIPRLRPRSPRRSTNPCIPNGDGITCVCWTYTPQTPRPRHYKANQGPKATLKNASLPHFYHQRAASGCLGRVMDL